MTELSDTDRLVLEVIGTSVPDEFKEWVFTASMVDDPALPRRVVTDEAGEFTMPGTRPETWRERAARLEDEVLRLRPLAKILGELDRCEHGRHEGDQCSGAQPGGCDGPSRGNPFMLGAWRVEDWLDESAWARIMSRFPDALPNDRLIGFTVHARPICVPDRAHMHDPAAWTQQ